MSPKVELRLTEFQLNVLRRFFNRGLRCCDRNHDSYPYRIGTEGTGTVAKAIDEAFLRAKAASAISRMRKKGLTK